ncbi:MAG: hypothetical protein ACHP93_02310 [Solirubrobacterales bacterium]
MDPCSFPTPVRRFAAARLLALTACLLSLVCIANVGGAIGAPRSQSGQPGVAVAPQEESAKLEQCVTSVVQAERSATFAGEMTAVADTAHMAMRVDVQQRLPGEALFHTLSAPGLGVWRSSDPKVKVYKYLKQVTNLSAPAVYRGLVRFRWLNAKGHVSKHAERLTPRCAQPAAPPSRLQSPAGGSSSTAFPLVTG